MNLIKSENMEESKPSVAFDKNHQPSTSAGEKGRMVHSSEINPEDSFGLGRFNIEKFKANYPDTYQKILKGINNNYESTFKSLNQEFDPNKYRKAIEDKVYHDCLEWYTASKS